jgi:glutaredoxin
MILYTTVNCNPCKVVKTFIEQNELDVEIRTLSLEEFRSEEIQSLGLRSVPTLIDNGKLIVNSGNIIEYLKKNL